MRTFKDEIDAAWGGYIEGLQALLWDKDSIFYAPAGPLGTDEIDEGSPFCWWYDVNDCRGFLICWPLGTRLRIQTYPTLVAYTWWLDPTYQIISEQAAA